MNESQADTTNSLKNLAWFKLSEFIFRGEKERAFNIYKLLMLAFDCKPFCLLVEGDLYLAFNETKTASEKYLAAAKIYEQEKNIFLTTITYEALVKNTEKNTDNTLEYWQKLLPLYNAIGYKPKIVLALKNLFKLFLNQKEDLQAKKILDELKKINCSTPEEETWALYLLQKNDNKNEALEIINKILEEYITKNNSLELQTFLYKLETLDKEAYNMVIAKMKG